MNLKNVLISNIKVGDNTRGFVDKKELEDLKKSIEASGLLQPVGVKEKSKGKYELVYGFRRLECFKLLGKKEIPSIIVDTTDGVALHIIENLQRKDIAPLDLAAAIKKYRDKSKLTLNEIAKVIGKSIHEVSQVNRLNELHLPLCKYLESGKMGLDAAYFVCRFPEQEQKDFYNRYKGDNRIEISDADSFFRYRNLRLKDFPWKLDKVFSRLPQCTKCNDRSSCQSVLFPELKDEDSCLNKNCFENKIKANLNDIIKETNSEDLIFVEGDTYSRFRFAPEGARVYSKDSLKKVTKKSEGTSIGVIVHSDNITNIGKIGIYQKLAKSKSESSISGKAKMDELSPAEQKKRKLELYKRKCDLIMFPLAGEIGKEITAAIKEAKFSEVNYPANNIIEALRIVADYVYEKANYETEKELNKIWDPEKDKADWGKTFQMLITASTYQCFNNLDDEYFSGSTTYQRLRETATVFELGLNEIENKLKPKYDQKINQLTERFIRNNKFDPRTGI